MYYNTILQLLAALTNVVGTGYAVLSILKLKPIDLYKSITIDGMDQSDETSLVQRKQARVGICLVVYAWFLQVLFLFLKVSSIKIFIACMHGYVVTTDILCLVLFLSYRRFSKKYFELRENLNKNNRDRHLDSHTITEFRFGETVSKLLRNPPKSSIINKLTRMLKN